MPRDIKYAKIHLIGLKPNNVDEFYSKNFNRWLLLKSSKVKFNERLIENPIERFFLMLPKNENGEPHDGVVEISGTTPEGFELSEYEFIHDELIILTPLYNEIEKTTNTALRIKLKHYIDFLNQRKEQIEKINTTKQQSISSQQLKTKLTDTQLNTLADELINKGFIASTDKECFVWAFGGKNDINTFTQIKWLKKKNLCVYLIDKIAYDPASPLPIWEIGSNIFDIQNMAQIKEGYLNNKNRNTPVNSEIIDTIITTASAAK